MVEITSSVASGSGNHATTPGATLARHAASRRIKHCRACGTVVAYRIPSDDNRERAVCNDCGTVHYENPLNVVGTVPVWQDRVLLCKRNIEPRYGMWTLPAGFMEVGETTEAGALRETDEEAGARIELQGLFTLLNVVPVAQVHFFYLARLLDTDFNPGPGPSRRDSSSKRRCRGTRSPSAPCAMTLEHYFADRRARPLRPAPRLTSRSWFGRGATRRPCRAAREVFSKSIRPAIPLEYTTRPCPARPGEFSAQSKILFLAVDVLPIWMSSHSMWTSRAIEARSCGRVALTRRRSSSSRNGHVHP